MRSRKPIATHPTVPGYDIVDESECAGLLPWTWAPERLTSSHDYFLATIRPDGHPHCIPVWGVWLDDRFCFSTGEQSAKARNLAVKPTVC